MMTYSDKYQLKKKRKNVEGKDEDIQLSDELTCLLLK